MKRSSQLQRRPFRVPLAEDGTPVWSSLTRRPPSRLAVVSSDGAAVHPIRRQQRKDTGPASFTAKVRTLVRERADHACEACALHLGPYGGQLQHRVARGMGGSRNPVLGSPANAVLLCGTPSTGCHGRCEARDAGMHANGFWLWQYESPIVVPVRVHGSVRAWLLPDGRYSYELPEGAA